MRLHPLLPLLLLALATTQVVSASLVHAAIVPVADHPAIINGAAVTPTTYDERWRSTVAVLARHDGISQYCGGALIDERTVLTAAHCTRWSSGSSISAGQMTIAVGQRVPGAGGDVVSVERITPHPQFNEEYLLNDIAVLRLTRAPSVEFATIQPTSRADETWWGAGSGRGIDSDSVGPWIAGWGATNPSSSAVAPALNAAKVPIAPDAACASTTAPGMGGNFVPTSMVCAGVPGNGTTAGGGVDTCNGDSGGPLIVGNGAGSWRLVGLTSWGYACAGPNYGVYTRVGAFVSWIEPLRFAPSSQVPQPITEAPAVNASTNPPGGGPGTGPTPAESAVGPIVVTTPPTVGTVLAAPTGLRVVTRTRHALVVVWRAVRAGAGAGTIRYRVLRRTARGWRVLATTSGLRTTLRGLASGRAVALRVQAFAADGRRSAGSSVVVARTRPGR